MMMLSQMNNDFHQQLSKSISLFPIFRIQTIPQFQQYQMNHEDCNQQQPQSELDQHLVNIKDYSQHQQSDPEDQDSPFDQLENIFGDDENRASRNEHTLAERVKELQVECKHLKEKCVRLGEKVVDLSTDLAGFEELTREEAELDPVAALQLLERQLMEFKQSFEDYRGKQGKAMLEKDAEIAKLKQENERINTQKTQVQSERNSLMETNEELSHANESLILEIQQLQTDLAESKTEMQSSRSHRLGPQRRDHGFESEVQAQLEILIQKLMAELELERGQKRRLNEEIKNMQKETIMLEKEITAKNNKIYQLEMSYLKNGRANHNLALQRASGAGLGFAQRDNQGQRQPYLRGNNEQRSSRYGNLRKQPNSKNDRVQSSPRSRTLMEIINSGELQDRDRLMLGVRLIDFFSKKISAKEYLCYDLDALLIGNFSKGGISPSLITVRKNTASSAPVPTEASQEKMICNLGEILDFLLGEYLSQVKTEDSGEEYVMGLIGEIVNQNSGNLNDVYVIKQLLEDCLKNLEEGGQGSK